MVCKIHTFEANLMPGDEGSLISNNRSIRVFMRKEAEKFENFEFRMKSS